jgi:hypothetical protein
MILKKGLLTVFYKTLATRKPVKFSVARVRDALIKNVFDILHTYENDRKKIYEKYCTKGKDGKPLITNNQYSFKGDTDEKTKENVENVIKEVEILDNEEVEIAVANQPIILDCIENT